MCNLTKDEFNLLINIIAALAILFLVIAVYLLIREVFKNHEDYE